MKFGDELLVLRATFKGCFLEMYTVQKVGRKSEIETYYNEREKKFALNLGVDLEHSTYILCTLLLVISNNADLISGPCESVRRQPLRCQLNFVTSSNDENGGDYYGSVACVTLLYRRFNPDDMSMSGSIEMLHSLQFLPVFVECKNLDYF